MSTVEYHPDHFVFVDAKPDTKAAFNVDARTYPCEMWLHPDSRVVAFCDFSVKVFALGGWLHIGERGSVSFTTDYLSIDVETLNGPLAIGAADHQEIPVEFEHSNPCACQLRTR